MSSLRTILIGLDGMPYRLIRDLADSGTMPNTKTLIEQGVFRPMASSIPEISSVAWSSIITGANPAEHGIYGFTDLAVGTYRIVYPNFASLKSPPFWDQAAFGRCVILNVPSTYPARALNGALVAGFVALNLEKATYPPALVPKLKELDYRTDVDFGRASESIPYFLNDLDKALQARIAAYRYLWSHETWDTFMLVFTGTDRLAHFLWDAYEEETHEYHAAFLEHLEQVDAIIGEIADGLGPNDRLVMISDHGFERLDKELYVNYELRRRGLLAFQEGAPARLTNLSEQTVAFALDPGRIYLHMQTKYPRGSVSPQDRPYVLEDLEALYRSLEVEGKPAIKRVYRKEEIYAGPLLDRAPDLVLLANAGLNLRATIEPRQLWDTGIRTGKHSPDAFFLAAGSIDPATIPSAPSVEDVVGILENGLTQ
jgi:predicted AlkP superfamily phosphohydrolase/phosphomutase